MKLIIFDLGGVCFNYEEYDYLELLAERNNLNAQELKDYYDSKIKPMEMDQITVEQLWEQLMETFGITGDIDEMIKEMMSLRKFDPELSELIKELRKNHKTAYLGNYARKYAELSAEKFNLSEWFDFGVLSYQIGVAKPDVKGFQVILDHFQIKPEEALFIDDSEKNLINPSQLGIKTIHFQNVEQLKEELKS